MAHTVRFTQPIRSNLSPPFRFSLSARYDRLHTLTKRVEAPSSSIDRLYTLTKIIEAPLSIRRLLSSNLKSYVQRFVHKSTFSNSGCQFSMARLCGMSIVVGSVGFLPHYSSSDVYDMSPEDHRMNNAASDSDESSPAFLILVKKLLAPSFYYVDVLGSSRHYWS